VTTPVASVSLREISAGNRAAVEALAVAEAQTIFVDGVTASIAEAAEVPEARPWFRAIYAGDQPVGFVMIADGVPADLTYLLGPYFLWRLLIDEHHQRHGYGEAALRLVVGHVRARPDGRTLLTSVHPGPGSPLGFYLGLGFRETGAEHNGELVLELDLTRTGRLVQPPVEAPKGGKTGG
jgi:diamine N-acetyltransferase